jgi:FKBP-type peptidyl-prolyl cis-trans isomerase FklB
LNFSSHTPVSRIKNWLAGASVLFLSSISQAESLKQGLELSTDSDKLSYAIGVVFGKRLQQEATGLNLKAFDAGLRDSYQNQPLLLSDDQIRQVFEQYKTQRDAIIAQQMEQLAKDNLTRAQQFLTLNKQEDGVKEISPGLQYKVLKTGKGAQPNKQDKVLVHYEGRLLSKKVFDSSYSRNEPVEFGVSDVVPGWTQALQQMREGDQWMVWISPELAYGPGGSGPIGPNELLEFKMELLKVNP